MMRTTLLCGAIAVSCVADFARGADPRTVDRGSTLVVLDQDRLADHGVSIDWPGDDDATTSAERGLLTVVPGARLGAASAFTLTHRESITLRGAKGSIVLDGFVLRGRAGASSISVLDARNRAMLELRDIRFENDPATSLALIHSGQLVVTQIAADALGAPSLADQSIGYLVTRAEIVMTPEAIAREGEAAFARSPNATCGGATGPDVIIGDLPAVASYGSIGGIAAFAVGTTSCNLGDNELLWVYNKNQHPVIAQNMYRMKNGRFEQIGMSWLKHGFAALTFDICGCGCVDPGTSQRLGVGCSDPYSSGLNGLQTYLGPRSEVNAFTGKFLYPYGYQDVDGDTIYKRLQVHISDIDPSQDGGGTYFAEGQYITADDANTEPDNNCSYRRVTFSGAGAAWSASVAGMPATVRGKPAIRAWKTADPSVVETDVRIPNEGLVLLAAKASDIGGGMWHYEYALQNINSDRSIRGVTVPVLDAATVQNIGFHDVDYHSGEPFDGTDWPGLRISGAVRWMTDTYAANPDANALRWGSLYNVRFDADAPPEETTIALAMFKSGKPNDPDTVYVRTVGPAPQLLDCNTNGTADASDIANGDSADCNTNGLPDECEDFAAVRMTAVQVATGLASPVAAASPPEDFDRLFICEQNTGRIRILKNDVLLPTPFLDIGSLISAFGQRGLLGIAFHPNYASNGYFYVNYTNVSGNTIIARYEVSAGDPDIANAASAVILKAITQDSALHNGGQLAFGPDGYLYVGTGEGTSGSDPLNHSQDVNSLLGKILRLDVDAADPYIPPTNPYVGTNGLDEIWALGLRNPWRFSFDRQTGDMYIADAGESTREEIDFQPAESTGGANYGWRCYEGTAPFNLAGCSAASAYEFPLYEYGHSGGACTIIGGFAYRGCKFPQLRGTYFFADFCAGWVRSFRHHAGGPTPPAVQDRSDEFAAVDGLITSFAEDAAGELYVLTFTGNVYRMEPAPSIAATCGNSIVEYGEMCDDGNTSFGDGCDEHCQLESVVEDHCAGAITLCPDMSEIGDTTGAASDGSASCGDSAGGPTHWYRYVPASDGVAVFNTCGSDFDTVLSVHRGCPASEDNQLSCNDDGCGTGDQGSRIVLAVNAGEVYYLRVSGYDGAAGEYTLSVSGPTCTSVCGNGIVEVGEECEPPDSANCDTQCQFPVCAYPTYVEGFESGAPAGWTFNAAGSTATQGAWVAGDPDGTNTGGDFVQPEDASAGSGCAFTSPNTSLNDGDVDGGVTYLLSPPYDLTGLPNARVRYDRWFYNGVQGGDANDYFIAEISDNNGGSWVTLELVDDNVQANNWTVSAFELDSLISFTNTVRVRFGVSDGAGVDDLIEGAVDAFQITTCTDCNSNSIDDYYDIANEHSTDINANTVPDDCEVDGDVIRGALLYDNWPLVSTGLTPTSNHPLWPFRPDLISNSATGITTWYCWQCHGWDYQGVDGEYAAGSHRTGFPGIFGTTLSDEDLFTLLDQPPTNDGGPGVLNGHDLGAYMPEADIIDLIAFLRLGTVDIDAYVDGGGMFIGDEVQGQAKYQTNPMGPSCLVCHGANGTNINFGTPLEPEWLAHVANDDRGEFLHKVRFAPPGTSMPNYVSRGTTQDVADIGAYIQHNFPTLCTTDSQCDDGRSCNGMETCGTNGCEPGVYTGCDVGCDFDCDIDLADFAVFQRCYTGDVGTGTPIYPPGCDCLDYDGDGDVDHNDHAEFLNRFSGADVPAAGCPVP
ncbi:MAG: PQQ-dependent sugar dehydrogenase [Phycisphaerales bacterium]|nr:PQQ-dependent sugar dehydrogenase [Phycisphaerales bacterium]